MTLHDLFTLQILHEINIGVQYIKYTSEYILKLQIHQHGIELSHEVFVKVPECYFYAYV